MELPLNMKVWKLILIGTLKQKYSEQEKKPKTEVQSEPYIPK